MTQVVRAYLASVAVIVLVLSTAPSWGTYTPSAIIGAVTAAVLACTACLWPNSPARAGAGDAISKHITRGIAITALVLTLGSPFYARVFEHAANRPEVDALLPIISLIGFVITVSLLLNWKRRPKLWSAQVSLLFASGAILRVAAVLASPSPAIDVYTALRDAPSHVLRGENPYTAAYEHPYDSPPTDYDRYPFYPPLPIVFGVPFAALGLDVRFVDVICDVLAAFVLYLVGVRRGSPMAGAMAAATYLHLPRAPFVIAEAWYEPMLAATLGSGFYFAETGRRLGYFLLGIGLTGKQFGIALFGPILMSLRHRWRSLFIGIALAVVIVVLPFLLWNPVAFIEVVYEAQLQRPPRDDAVTIQNGIAAWCGLMMPRLALWGVAITIVIVLSIRAPRQTAAAALWAGAALLTFVLFHTQSFFNYFYLCAYLFLLGILGLMPTPPPASSR